MKKMRGLRALLVVLPLLVVLAASCRGPMGERREDTPEGAICEPAAGRHEGLDSSMIPLCRAVCNGDRKAEPALAAHPLVDKMSRGMGEQLDFSPEPFAASAFSDRDDPRFSWSRLKKNAPFVEPFATYVVDHGHVLITESLARATELLSAEVDPEGIRTNLVCGSPWDAFVLIFDEPEIFIDLGFYGDRPLGDALLRFRAILTHELWHLAFLQHQWDHWPVDYRVSDSRAALFLYRMLNEGVGHYYSIHHRLHPEPDWDDFPERERKVFALLEGNYPMYIEEPDAGVRRDLLWSSHAGVPFWEKWGALPGALVVYRLESMLGKGGVRRAILEEPFTLFLTYDKLCREHPTWPRLPARLVDDAGRALRRHEG